MGESNIMSLENNIDSTKKNQLSDRILIPYFSLYSDRLVIHPRVFNAILSRSKNVNSLKNLKKKKFTGKISKTQKTIITKKLNAWLNAIIEHNIHYKTGYNRKEHYPVFITLTLSGKQKHSDQEIKRNMLDLFIKKLKSEFNVSKYFWRAESQKNGNIHFHIIVDKYCDKLQLQQIWNRIQLKNGYLQEHYSKFGNYDPPSTHVKGISEVDNFINYVLKYCAKEEDNRKIKGRIFGMSDELRSINIFQSILDSEISYNLLKAKDKELLDVYKHEYFTVFYFKPNFYKSYYYIYFKNLSHSYYLNVYDSIYKGKVTKTKKSFEFKERIIKRENQLSLFSLSEQIGVINNYNTLRSKDEKKFKSIRKYDEDGNLKSRINLSESVNK